MADADRPVCPDGLDDFPRPAHPLRVCFQALDDEAFVKAQGSGQGGIAAQVDEQATRHIRLLDDSLREGGAVCRGLCMCAEEEDRQQKGGKRVPASGPGQGFVSSRAGVCSNAVTWQGAHWISPGQLVGRGR